MAPFARMLPRGFHGTIVTAALVTALFIGYVIYVEVSAVGKADVFCRDTAIGSSVEHLIKRAAAAGAVDLNDPAARDGVVKREIRWVRLRNGDEILPVTFLGFAAQMQHFCSITARGGIVTFREVKHLD